MKLNPLAAVVMIATSVLVYYGLVYIEAWTIETLCRELLRCAR